MNSAQWLMRRPARLIAAAALCLPAACASAPERDIKPRTITLAEFARSDAQPAAATAPVSPASTPAASAPANVETASSRPSSPSSPSSHAEPAAGAAKPAERAGVGERLLNPGDQVIVDSLIGQVSGRPIFADQFLAPISDQLRVQAEKAESPQKFLPIARAIIRQRLREIVLNELFLAEAENALTEQQQQGLLAFIRDFREKSIAEAFGSLSRRESELQQEGRTLDQYVEEYRNQALIGNLINQKIEPRVIVSWKDVEREYERRKAEFNPPGTVTLQRIRVDNNQADVIDDVKRRLAAGEDFAGVADAAGEPNHGTWDTFKVGPNGIEDVIDEYKPFLKDLHDGLVTPSISYRDRTVWLRVAHLDQPAAKSLYDVQRQLIAELLERRRAEEREKYIRGLFEKGIYDELDAMADRILAVAMLRYGK